MSGKESRCGDNKRLVGHAPAARCELERDALSSRGFDRRVGYRDFQLKFVRSWILEQRLEWSGVGGYEFDLMRWHYYGNVLQHGILFLSS